MWFWNPLLVANFLSHEMHWRRWEPSPCADNLWYFRGVLSVNALGHWLHMNFLIIKWTARICIANCDFTRNIFSQSLHGTSLVSSHASLCRLRPEFWENDFRHLMQLYGFSFVWVLMWVFRCCLIKKLFLHSVQAWYFKVSFLSQLWILELWINCECWKIFLCWKFNLTVVTFEFYLVNMTSTKIAVIWFNHFH